GASVEQVAAAAGVPEERIERFAYPVLLERSRYAELAQQAHPIRDDGPDVRTLGDVVSHTFGLRGQEYGQAEWDSWRGDDNKWVVSLSWSVGHSDITARWAYHPGAHGGTVTALDEHATDLVDGHLSRPPRRVGPVVDFSKPDGAEETDSAPAASTSVPKTSSPGTTERSTAAADRPTDRANSGAAERAANRATGTDQSAGRRATKTTTGSGPRGRAEAAKSGQGDSGSNAGTAEPAKPDSSTGAAAKRPASRKAKPVMPSWEDVLLGVKRS
ncbi:MAG: hypothetical protein QOF38_3602, partial [Pseudonocardiales bacterium]|nr:hypothetical protein [Pseudonocardiales bacterium]